MMRVTWSLVVSGRGGRGPGGCSLRPRGSAAGRSGGGAKMVTSTRVIRIVAVEFGDTVLRVIDANGELLTTVPGTSTGEISRFKAHGGKHPR